MAKQLTKEEIKEATEKIIDQKYWDNFDKEAYQKYLAAKDAWRTKMN